MRVIPPLPSLFGFEVGSYIWLPRVELLSTGLPNEYSLLCYITTM